jgi:hypothetical protein
VLQEVKQQLRDRVASFDELLSCSGRGSSLSDLHLRMCRAHTQRWLHVVERAAMPAQERAATELQPTSGGAPWLGRLARACQVHVGAPSGSGRGRPSPPWLSKAARADGDMRVAAAPVQAAVE